MRPWRKSPPPGAPGSACGPGARTRSKSASTGSPATPFATSRIGVGSLTGTLAAGRRGCAQPQGRAAREEPAGRGVGTPRRSDGRPRRDCPRTQASDPALSSEDHTAGMHGVCPGFVKSLSGKCPGLDRADRKRRREVGTVEDGSSPGGGAHRS
jgi:hypothetical protein